MRSTVSFFFGALIVTFLVLGKGWKPEGDPASASMVPEPPRPINERTCVYKRGIPEERGEDHIRFHYSRYVYKVTHITPADEKDLSSVGQDLLAVEFVKPDGAHVACSALAAHSYGFKVGDLVRVWDVLIGPDDKSMEWIIGLAGPVSSKK